MLRREFIRKRFERDVNLAIQSIVNGQGTYTQYVDAADHYIKISFEVLDNFIVADIFAEYDTHTPYTHTKINIKGWVKIQTTLEEAIIDLVEYAQIQTNYKPSNVED